MNRQHSFEPAAFVRGLFLIVSTAVYTCILAPPVIIALLLDRSGRWFSAFERTGTSWLLGTNGIRLNVLGLENLEKRHSYILISNQLGILDIPGIISALPFPIRSIAKRSLTRFPIFEWSPYLSIHILIDRDTLSQP
jgi:1-acyl-sn-glycerol-3-phosphate acyltransferase